MADVFISYSRKDIAFARLLHEALIQNELETWIDWQDIPPSADWLAEVYEAIEAADAFVFIISETSLDSEICNLEIQHAAKHNKRLIPIVIKDVDAERVPEELAAVNWIFFDDAGEKFEQAMEDLVTAITVDQDWVKAHTRFGMRALEWQRKDKDRGLLLRGSDLTEAEAWLAGAAGKEPSPTSLQADYILESRRDASRRQRRTLIGVATALVVAIGLGILAWTQRNVAVAEGQARATAQAQAEEQREIAEQQRDIAEEQQAVAEEQREIADEQRNVAVEQRDLILTRQLAAQGLVEARMRFDLGLLLGLEADRRTEGATWTRGNLYEIMQSSPRLLAYLRGHTNDVVAVAISPNNQIVATGSGDNTYVGNRGGDNTIRFWDVSDPAHIEALGVPQTYHRDGVLDLTFNPAGQVLASAGVEGEIVLWDVSDPATPRKIGQSIQAHEGPVRCLDFRTDGSLLASGGEDGTIRLWDVREPEDVRAVGEPIEWQLGAVQDVEFSPNGNYLAPISFNKFFDDLVLWDIRQPATPRLVRIPDAGQSDIVVFSQDERLLASRSYTGTLSIWDVSSIPSITLVSRRDGEASSINAALAFSPDGKLLASSGGEKTISLWDLNSPEMPALIGQPLVGHSSDVIELAFSPDGRTLISGSSDNSAILWDVADPSWPSSLGTRQASKDLLQASVVMPNGRTLLVGGSDGMISSWNAGEPGSPSPEWKNLEAHPGTVLSLAISRDGLMAASGSSNETIKLWEVDSDGQLHEAGTPLLGHSWLVGDVAFHPEGELLASAAGEAILWDITDPSRSRPLKVVPEGRGVAFSPDGITLAVAGVENTLQLWDVSQKNDPQMVVEFEKDQRWLVQSLEFGRESQVLYTGDFEGNLELWDVSNPTEIRAIGIPIPAHEGAIHDIAIHPRNTIIALASADNKVSLWNLEDLTAPVQIGQTLNGHTNSVVSLGFSPDGKYLISVGGDSVIRWRLDFDGINGRACRLANRNLSRSEWEQYFPADVPYHLTCTNQE